MTFDFYKSFEKKYRSLRELIKPKQRVYLLFVEPLLFKNIAINNISSKVNVDPVALSGISEVLALELSNTNIGDHRIRPSSPAPVSFGEESERLTKEIFALSLDSLDKEVEFSWSNALVWTDT